jgi:type VI secretion system secreted protein Hcp
MAAVDYFLKIEGIPGESVDAKHKAEIEVVAWSWGETAPVSSEPGGGGGAGKVTIEDLNFTSRVSKASPPLMLACASGKHIKSALLTARRGGKAQTEFLIIKLRDVLVSSYQTAAGGGGDDSGLLDSISLNFSHIEVEYRETKPDGSLSTPVKFGWDVKRNVAV